MKKISAVLLIIAIFLSLAPSYSLAASVTFTALDGTQSNVSEGYKNLIDGNTGTKWCTTFSGSAYIILKASDKITLNGYAFTTGNDTASYSGRNPKDWTIYGCNDYDGANGSWQKVTSVENDSVLQAKNKTRYAFTVNDDNSDSYQFYKLEITSTKGEALMQLSEIDFQYTVGEVGFRALDGTNGSGNESYHKLLDGNSATKWGVNFSGSAYVIIKSTKMITLTGYAFTTGNDNASYKNRNPKNWTIYGCNDYDGTNGSWEAIQSVENDSVLEDKNKERYTFNIDSNTKAYKYYKLEITATKGAEFLQLSEMELMYVLCVHSWVKVSETAANCTEPSYITEKCEKCGAEAKAEVSPALGHDFGGNKECSRCGAVTTAQVGDKFYEDIHTALDEASSESTVTMLNNAEIADELCISKNITLNLNGFTLKTTGNTRSIKVTDSSTFTLEDLSGGGKIDGSGSGGGINVDNGTFNMTGGAIENCTATGYGGGVYVTNGTFNMSGGTISGCSAKRGGGIYVYMTGTFNMTGNSLITNCTASEHGGGIYSYNNTSKVSITDGRISECSAEWGGGIYALGGIIDIHGSTFENCTADYGGGFYANAGTTTVDQDTKFKNNHAEKYDGGGMYVSGKAVVNAENIIVSGNDAQKNGGGIYLAPFNKEEPTLTLNNSQISEGNHAKGNGGGICVEKHYYADKAAVLKMSGTQISDNTADADGGGIWIETIKETTVTDSSILNNEAKGSGGGAAISGSGSADNMKNLMLKNTEIQNNRASNGGGIWAGGSAFNITGSRITDNTASVGGGMYLSDENVSAEFDILTVMGNIASGESGGIYCNTSSINIIGGTHVYSNNVADYGALETGGELIPVDSNLCLYNGSTINLVNPVSELETGYFETMIGVTVDGGGRVTATSLKDQSEFFFSDNSDYKVFYGDSAVCVGNPVCVTIDYGYENISFEKKFLKGTILSFTNPTRDGYTFGGWFVGSDGFDFSKPVSEDITLTAKWLTNGENALSITPEKLYIVSNADAVVYVGAYKGGKLTDVKSVASDKYTAVDISELGLDTSNADTLSAFMWDSAMTPLCKGACTAVK